MSIHASAIVSKKAKIADDVSIGPFCIISDESNIGFGTIIESFVQIKGKVTIGKNCFIGSGSIIGDNPQSIDFKLDTKSDVRIGDNNNIREYVTIHRSIHENSSTIVGNNNYLMIGSHVGHDCVIGSNNVFANNVLIAGHVTIYNNCFVGGGTGFHQFIRLGSYSMIQGNSSFSLDIPPYVIGGGLNLIHGVNSIGLRRANFSTKIVKEIKEVFQNFYIKGETLDNFLKNKNINLNNELEEFYNFLKAPSKKGICRKFGKL